MTLRTDFLLENSLPSRVKALRAKFDEIKTSQIAGSGNLQPSRVVTGNPVDIAATVTYNTVSIWEVTFTPTNQAFDNTGFLWHSFYSATLVSGTSSLMEVTEQLPSDGHTTVQRLYLMGRASGFNSVLNIQVVIYAVGTGTISIVHIV